MAIITPSLPQIAVILLAGGSGERAALGLPKQQALLGGKPVLAWSFDRFAARDDVTAVVLVGDPVTQALIADHPKLRRTGAGATRRLSVSRGLVVLADLPGDAIVLVHDSARPGVTDAVIDRLLAALTDDAAGALPVLPVADTLVTTDSSTAGDVTDRSRLARVQTPQAFPLDRLRTAHADWTGDEPTDDAQMVRRQGGSITAVTGEAVLHKLTWAEDVAIIAALMGLKDRDMDDRRIAVGNGYDVHRLVADKPLWLCGIEIAHSHGLSGHSDADVALHALTDAILGALADGDIGQHFPPSDAKWRGAASHRFVRFAAERVAMRGGVIEHVDLTIIAEAPRVGPHRDAMRAAVAEMLGIALDRVSVKATTTEGLGFTGRREGIAAQATATLSLPR
ncbi:MAG: bifunctional 2-C-methyl-D-erythritol 4-phosphate cytidylyltransferase/2-C-methyl-D-erythritol 2,4-cyclodiphosphate synthase [Sphingopyxis sp.]|nr:bifunctional 2-C-methyl-D-erythritol 4-phosphate cytidylyltransferase/2-C-methyl-D-erythritol 2,4-cyclodiphosphate synthase [Sphingopyxis sp.]